MSIERTDWWSLDGEEKVKAIAAEIRSLVGGLRFGIENPVEADYEAWAHAAVNCPNRWPPGYGVWAAEWIRSGYPKPPRWMEKQP